jgi:hypothetical protein
MIDGARTSSPELSAPSKADADEFAARLAAQRQDAKAEVQRKLAALSPSAGAPAAQGGRSPVRRATPAALAGSELLKDSARRLGVSDERVRQLVREGRLSGKRVHDGTQERWFVQRDDVDRLIAERAAKSSSQSGAKPAPGSARPAAKAATSPSRVAAAPSVSVQAKPAKPPHEPTLEAILAQLRAERAKLEAAIEGIEWLIARRTSS